jgi:hypothetical protein
VGIEGRWWNGRWGRNLRRDIWLLRETRWMVRARHGNADAGREAVWEFAMEHEARAMVDRLIRADSGNGWKDITRLIKDRPGQRPGNDPGAASAPRHDGSP